MAVIKVRRLEWFRHVVSKGAVRPVKKLTRVKPGGRRREGRPRLRWMDDDEQDPVAYPGILFGGGVQQIQLRTEDRENGHLGAVAP